MSTGTPPDRRGPPQRSIADDPVDRLMLRTGLAAVALHGLMRRTDLGRDESFVENATDLSVLLADRLLQRLGV